MLRSTRVMRTLPTGVAGAGTTIVSSATISSSSTVVASSSGTPSAAVVASLGAGEWVAGIMAKSALGIASTGLGFIASASVASNPVALLVACGFVMRGATLPLSLYGDRCVARIACALPQVQEAFQLYQGIANHPRAIVWEKKVAAQKMQNDRTRIFREHRTNNVLIVVPHLYASCLSMYLLLGMPSQSAANLVGLSSATGSTATAMSTTSSLLAAADPMLALAATLTSGCCWFHLQRRVGFNDMLDAYVSSAKRAVGIAWIGMVVASLFAATPGFIPAYLGPVWLGMSLAGLLKVALNATAPTRFLCGIAEYPPEHGTYGSQATAAAHEYRLAVTSFDSDEQYRSWLKAKKTMEFECDGRIYKLMKTIGVYNALEEFEFEQERGRAMVKKAAEKRRAAAAAAAASGAAPSDAAPKQSSSTFDAASGTRRWGNGGGLDRRAASDNPLMDKGFGSTSGYIKDVSLAASMEAQLEEEKQIRLRKLKAYDDKVAAAAASSSGAR
jgi:outer membrane lipopolysaccharide assembly protein LptE/RlpB